MPQLCCENITVAYGYHTAIEDVCFCIEKGDYICLVGENGSGKSTLLQTIVGLLTPKSGRVIRQNADGLIGYLPQQSHIRQDFPATVGEVVMSGCLSAKGSPLFNTKDRRETALQWMEALEIAGDKNRAYHKLSGGQQRRALRARALCANPGLLVLDEPTTGLDPHSGAGFYRILKDLNTTRGISIIMSTHDIHSAVSNAKSILHIQKRVKFFGSSGQYADSELYRSMTQNGEGEL